MVFSFIARSASAPMSNSSVAAANRPVLTAVLASAGDKKDLNPFFFFFCMTRKNVTFSIRAVPQDHDVIGGIVRINAKQDRYQFRGICLPFEWQEKVELLTLTYNSPFFYGNNQDLSIVLRRGFIHHHGDTERYCVLEQAENGRKAYRIPVQDLQLGGQRQRTLDLLVDGAKNDLPALIPRFERVVLSREPEQYGKVKQTTSMSFNAFPAELRDRAFAEGIFYRLIIN